MATLSFRGILVMYIVIITRFSTAGGHYGQELFINTSILSVVNLKKFELPKSITLEINFTEVFSNIPFQYFTIL